jgi:MoaA/NifB/PqqE/SkfB family radical SAM enzyme
MQMHNRFSQFLNAAAKREVSFEIDLVPLHFQKLSLKKICNWVLTEGSITFKPGRPWGFPTILQLEPTSFCNLRCRVCPVGIGLDRPSGNMDMEMFRRLVDEIGKYLLVMMFWDWGEPFLNPDAFEMIQYARRAGIKVVCSTNGHVFANRDNARKLIGAGLDVLVVSLDGITQETYQTYRTRGNLETVLEGIRNVVSEKRLSGSPLPIVNLRFIVMKHSEHQIQHIESYARSLGVDVLTLRKFHFVPGTETWMSKSDAEHVTGSEQLIPSDARYQLPALPDGEPVRLTKNPCKNLWNCPSIHWNGTVCSCFMDYNEKRPLGSLKTQSLREIWYGSPYAQLRRAFRRSWQDLAPCGKCASGYLGGDIGRQANSEAFYFTKFMR